MPIYEFRCGKCGKLAEVMQRVGERPPPCPACGSRRMARAVSRTSFRLKGGGWHADLYQTPRPDKVEETAGAAPLAEKPAVPTGPVAPADPATPPAGAKQAGPEAASRPHRRRPASTRKRR